MSDAQNNLKLSTPSNPAEPAEPAKPSPEPVEPVEPDFPPNIHQTDAAEAESD